MTKIGLLVGRENTFPPAFIEHVNGRNAGITAEYCTLGGSRINEPSGYAVIIDRISHEVPYYRSYLKNAALNGTVVINDPFWFPADDKFIGSAIAEKRGVAVPRTAALPNHSYIPDISTDSLRNLVYPLNWQVIVDYTGLPAYLKPAVGGGWKYVFKVNSVEELIHAYDQSGMLPMVLQENIEFEQYVRCICLGYDQILPLRYNPRNPNMYERYEGDADAAFLGQALYDRVVGDARTLNRALGYTMNTVEFAVRDGVPYAIDFLNPACDLDSFSIGQPAFQWAVRTLADLAIGYAQHGPARAHRFAWEGPIAPEPTSVVAGGAPAPAGSAVAVSGEIVEVIGVDTTTPEPTIAGEVPVVVSSFEAIATAAVDAPPTTTIDDLATAARPKRAGRKATPAAGADATAETPAPKARRSSKKAPPEG